MKDENVIGHTMVGSGPQKVIVLHGWWSDHTGYEALFPILDHDAFTYAFMDYRGYGTSGHRTGDHTIAEIATDALSLADHLAWDSFHAVGHSMGGMAVQKMIALAPDRIDSAVLITPVPASGSSLDESNRDLFHGAAQSDENRFAILNYLTSSRLSDSWYSHVIKRSHETTDKAAFHDYMLAWTDSDFCHEVVGKNTPILVLVGEYDQAITADAMTQSLLEYFPAATIDIILNSGHFPMLETPARLSYIMEKYLKKHAGQLSF